MLAGAWCGAQAMKRRLEMFHVSLTDLEFTVKDNS